MSQQAALKLVAKPKKRRRDGAGYSIPAAAEEMGVSYKTLREAIERRQVRVIEFGGLMRVPKSEVERVKQLFEAGALPPRDWLVP